MQKHIFITENDASRLVITIEEKPEAVYQSFKLHGPPLVPGSKDVRRFKNWYQRAFAHYDSDPRPTISTDANTGLSAVVWGDSENSVIMSPVILHGTQPEQEARQ